MKFKFWTKILNEVNILFKIDKMIHIMKFKVIKG